MGTISINGHNLQLFSAPDEFIIYYDAVCDDFHADLRESSNPHDYVLDDDKVTLVIVQADWETDYSIQLDETDKAVTRPEAYGDSLEAKSFSGLAALISTGISTPAGLLTTSGGAPTRKARKEKLDDPYYPAALRERTATTIYALLGVEVDTTAIVNSIGQLVADLGAYSAVVECNPLGTVVTTCVAVKSATGYAPFKELIPTIKRDVRDYNRLYQAVEDMSGDLPGTSEITNINSAQTAGHDLLAELDVVADALRETDDRFKLDDYAQASLSALLGTQVNPADPILPQLDPNAAGYGKGSLGDLNDSLRLAVAALEAALNQISDSVRDLRAASLKAEMDTRELVDTFNGTYDANRRAWTTRANPRTILVPLSPLTGQKRVTVGLYGTPKPVRLTLVFPAKAGSVELDPPGSAVSPTAVPVEEAPAGATFLDSYVFDVHTLYRYKFGAGFIVSRVGKQEYGLFNRTVEMTGDDGKAKDVVVQEIRRTKSEDRQVQPVFYVVFHPVAKDLNAETYRGWRRAIPGGVTGFSLAEPTKHIYLGLSFEPSAGLDLNLGLHWGKVQNLLEGFEEGQQLAKDDELPIRESFERGFFWGVGIDSSVFAKLIAGIFKS